jgi:hypothetical protein
LVRIVAGPLVLSRDPAARVATVPISTASTTWVKSAVFRRLAVPSQHLAEAWLSTTCSWAHARFKSS